RHSGSVMPVKWIAIKIEATQYHEQDDCRAPDHQAESISARGFQEKELAEGVARRHYPDPGNDGIQHDKIKLAKMNGPSIKTHIGQLPQRGHLIAGFALDDRSQKRIKQIVRCNDQQSNGSDGRDRKLYQNLHDNHATTDDPGNARQLVMPKIKIKSPGK